jgi:hypothetical protein
VLCLRQAAAVVTIDEIDPENWGDGGEFNTVIRQETKTPTPVSRSAPQPSFNMGRFNPPNGMKSSEINASVAHNVNNTAPVSRVVHDTVAGP